MVIMQCPTRKSWRKGSNSVLSSVPQFAKICHEPRSVKVSYIWMGYFFIGQWRNLKVKKRKEKQVELSTEVDFWNWGRCGDWKRNYHNRFLSLAVHEADKLSQALGISISSHIAKIMSVDHIIDTCSEAVLSVCDVCRSYWPANIVRTEAFDKRHNR